MKLVNWRESAKNLRDEKEKGGYLSRQKQKLNPKANKTSKRTYRSVYYLIFFFKNMESVRQKYSTHSVEDTCNSNRFHSV